MFLKLYVKVRVFFENTEGASAIEYAIVAAMVAVVVVTFISPIGTEVKNIFTNIQAAIHTGAVASTPAAAPAS